MLYLAPSFSIPYSGFIARLDQREKIMKKIFFNVTIAVFICGFLLGRYSANKLRKTVSISKIDSTESKKEEVQSHAEDKKSLTTAQEMNYTEKFYSKKGILLHEISYGSKDGAMVTETTRTRSRTQINSDSHSIQNVTTASSYESNVLIGIYYPVSLSTNFKETEFSLSYRIFSSFYIVGMADLYFKKAAVGIMVGL
jgi:hypothetical protein